MPGIRQVWPWHIRTKPTPAVPPTVTGNVAAITLQPYTIVTIFGTNQNASIAEHVALIELFDKEMTSEKSVTLDGRKDRPYHVVGEENKFAVTWGPFPEQKKLQVALYRTVPSGNEIEPIDIIQELSDNKSRTEVTLLSIKHHDKDKQLTLRTVVNITRMKVEG